ncbi:MAG: hypothetical protein ABIP12_02755 [Terriglobales bacterium]
MMVIMGVSAMAQAQELTAPEIAERMVRAQQQSREQAQAYVAERKYHVAKKQSDDQGLNKSEITAEISFLPPGQKSFAIKKSTGGMAENVVRKTLEHEATVARNPGISSVTPDNYDFELVGKTMLDDRLCYVLKLHPKRDSKDLIQGTVWVDAQRFMVRRAEGKLAKNPSWWVKDVSVRVEYDDVAGVWIQTASTATAKVRLAGDYTLNSQHVRLQRAEVSAAVAPAPSNKKRRVLRSDPGLASSVTFGRE